MPLYEYACRTCDAQFEFLVRAGDVPSCPECGGRRLEKKFSVPAAHSQTSKSLPICDTPSFGGCGKPGCGPGGCAM
jgi:putative FmdB family regulatory protein